MISLTGDNSPVPLVGHVDSLTGRRKLFVVSSLILQFHFAKLDLPFVVVTGHAEWFSEFVGSSQEKNS